MRIPTVPLLALFLAACSPTKPVAVQHPPAVKVAAKPAPAPSSPLEAPHVSSREIAGITFEGVSFDARTHHLQVVDQPRGPGSTFPDAASAANADGGLAAANAGFFTPEGAPLGLVRSAGKSAGSWNSATSLGNAVWFETASGVMGIRRREAVGREFAQTMTGLIQAGPLLVEAGHSVGGLESTKSSIRTVLLWDGGSRWWLGRSSSCTLAEVGQALATGQPAGWPVRHALNLDGGRSSDVWISSNVAGGPLARRPPWNRPVRNFLVLLPSPR